MDRTLEVPYEQSKPLPVAYDAPVGDPGRWTPARQQGAVALAQLRAGGACLRTAHGVWDADEVDQRCVLCLASGEAREGGQQAIPRETVVHLLGACPALALARARFVDKYRAAMGRRRWEAPAPERVARWVLRQDPGRGRWFLLTHFNFS